MCVRSQLNCSPATHQVDGAAPDHDSSPRSHHPRARGSLARPLAPGVTWRVKADCRVPASTAQVQQTQAYCAGRFAEWDEKITTFPGLYALGAGAAWLVSLAGGGGGGASAGCTLPVLRAVNLLPALATPPLLLALLRRLHPEAAPADLLGNALLLVRVRVRPNPNPNPNPKP